jgi:FkbM family methyltransferase
MSFFRRERSIATVRLPWGSLIEVNPNEGIGRELVRQKVFDIAVSETAWRLLRPGDSAVDVGANIGYMTSLFAARVGAQGRVESFEPHPRILARLRRNVDEIGGRSPVNVRIHDCALGNRNGAAHLLEPSIFAMNEGASTVAVEEIPARPTIPANAHEVRIARLDTVLADREVALLKIDVEGFEGEVLAGADGMLARHRIQNIIYEAHDCERSPLHALLGQYGYTVFGIGHDLLGLQITRGSAAPRVAHGWESPSYLAALNPGTVAPALQTRGWRVLRAC